MTLFHIVILVITGTIAGFFSGLLGVGGGVIMVPVQYILFTNMGLCTDTAIKLALGTNLLVIFLTSSSGAWRHSQKGAVYWKVTIIMGGCGLVTASCAAIVAIHLPGEALKIALGVITILAGIRMLTAKPLPAELKPKDNPWLWAAWAIPTGIVTGMLGIGGGVLIVPILVLALKFRIHNAVATSLAIMLFTSTGALISFIINGLSVLNLPEYSIGYVHLPSWFVLTVTSVSTAQIGAITAHKLPAKQLGYIFAGVIFYVALKMLGVFDWLGWPI